MLVMGAGSSGALAQATIKGTTIGVTSTSNYMVSHRVQRHSWITADGAIHVLVNVGATPSTAALTLYSSFDGGATWAAMLTLPNTDQDSTADGLIANADNGSVLQLVYATTELKGYIAYAVATYDATTQAWQLASVQTAFASSSVLGSEPTLAIDGGGNLWCGFKAYDIATRVTSVQLLYQSATSGSWMTTGVTFGRPGTIAQHGSRVVAVPGGVILLYQQGKDLNWAYRTNSAPINADWNQSVLYADLPNAQLEDDDTDFSEAADAEGNLYLAFLGTNHVYTTTYSAAAGTWAAINALTSSNNTSRYTKASVVGATIAMMVQDGNNVSVYESTNQGATYTLTQALIHQRLPGDVYANARIEAPESTSGTLPVWQQFMAGASQGLLYFSVPVD